jgi:hypothetical protein
MLKLDKKLLHSLLEGIELGIFIPDEVIFYMIRAI